MLQKENGDFLFELEFAVFIVAKVANRPIVAFQGVLHRGEAAWKY